MGVVEIVVEDTTSPEGSLTVRMGAQGAEALQAAWDGSRELTLNQGLDLCFDNGNQILYWKSDARDKMLKDTDAALHSGETRAIKDYEGALPAPGRRRSPREASTSRCRTAATIQSSVSEGGWPRSPSSRRTTAGTCS